VIGRDGGAVVAIACLFGAVGLLAFVLRSTLRGDTRVLVRGQLGIAFSAGLYFVWLFFVCDEDGAFALPTIDGFLQLILAEVAWTIGWMGGLVRLFFLEEKPYFPRV
jgi:hypothetical protein